MQGREITNEQKEIFLKKLRLTFGNISKSSQFAGFSRNAAYENRKTDLQFGADWDDAIEMLADDAEQELHRRAVKGILKPVYYLGQKIGKVRHYSDRLLMFHLKSKRPDVYRERLQMDTNLNGSLDVSIAQKIDEIYETQDADHEDDDET